MVFIPNILNKYIKLPSITTIISAPTILKSIFTANDKGLGMSAKAIAKRIELMEIRNDINEIYL